MAGSPLKRRRKAGVPAADRSVIAFPGLNHPRAGLSKAQWRALSPGERLGRLFGMSLDDVYEVMSWPMDELGPYRLHVRMQVTRVVFMIGLKELRDGKLGSDAARERERQRILAVLLRDLAHRRA